MIMSDCSAEDVIRQIESDVDKAQDMHAYMARLEVRVNEPDEPRQRSILKRYLASLLGAASAEEECRGNREQADLMAKRSIFYYESAITENPSDMSLRVQFALDLLASPDIGYQGILELLPDVDQVRALDGIGFRDKALLLHQAHMARGIALIRRGRFQEGCKHLEMGLSSDLIRANEFPDAAAYAMMLKLGLDREVLRRILAPLIRQYSWWAAELENRCDDVPQL